MVVTAVDIVPADALQMQIGAGSDSFYVVTLRGRTQNAGPENNGPSKAEGGGLKCRHEIE